VSTNPLVEQFRRGGVPRDVKLMAAQGALPLKPEDLADLWASLSRDQDADIATAATASLTALPADQLLPIIKSKEAAEHLLSWAARCRPEQELREVALQNPSISDETLEALAPTLPQALAELVVINQQRLLRRTSLLEALESNPSLSSDQKRRLRELRETFKVGVVIAPPPPAQEREQEQEQEEEEEEAEPAPMTETEAQARYLTPEESGAAEKVSAVQKLYRLNTAEKLITAIKGSREERAILIRDPNRLVSAGVLGSPKVTESEIESFAAMKNVTDQVLRDISNHREWTKRYGVINGLVHNPRTPLERALLFVPRLTQRDLKSLAADRNVSEAIRKAAQRFIKGGGKK